MYAEKHARALIKKKTANKLYRKPIHFIEIAVNVEIHVVVIITAKMKIHALLLIEKAAKPKICIKVDDEKQLLVHILILKCKQNFIF